MLTLNQKNNEYDFLAVFSDFLRVDHEVNSGNCLLLY